MKTEVFRNEVRRLLRHTPFQPFVVSLENGDRLVIEHPENVAFDPRPKGASDFYAFSGDLRVYSSFDAISSVSMLQNGEHVEEEETTGG